MYKSPLTIAEIKAVAAEFGVTENCYLRGGKSSMLNNIISHFDTMRLFSTIIGTPEALQDAKKDAEKRDAFIAKAQVIEDNVDPIAKKW